MNGSRGIITGNWGDVPGGGFEILYNWANRIVGLRSSNLTLMTLKIKRLMLLSEDELYRRAKIRLEYQWDISTHAIGDAANRMVLNVYQRLREEELADDARTLRIEHAQIVHPSDQPRFADLNVVAAMRPVRCISDASMAEQRLGDQCSYGYPWRSLRNSGIAISAGSTSR